MRRNLLSTAPVWMLLLAGCSTVYTPGAQALPAASRAQLDANNQVDGRNYGGYEVTAIQIDGKSYPLGHEKTTFFLTPGKHRVAFTYSKRPPMTPLGRLGYFETAAGGKYRLASSYSSAGLIHNIETPDHRNVLQWDVAGIQPGAIPPPGPNQRSPLHD